MNPKRHSGTSAGVRRQEADTDRRWFEADEPHAFKSPRHSRSLERRESKLDISGYIEGLLLFLDHFSQPWYTMWYEEEGASISTKALERTGGEAGCYVRVPVAAGRYCRIDMHVPPCVGPAPHRRDFEEMFTIVEGEIEVTFRGEKSGVHAGETVNIPANAPNF